MKTKLYAWVAVDGNGEANMFRVEPKLDRTGQMFVAYESYFIPLGECKPIAGQCWRIEIPGPKTATKKRRAAK